MAEAIWAAGVYIATVIGAGFASGSEVVSYFVRYGRISILGIVLASMLFGLLATLILKRSNQWETENFYSYLHQIMPAPLAELYKKLAGLFMLVVFVAMASGTGEAMGDFFGISKSWGVLLLCVLCYIVFCYDLRGLMAANGVLSVLIIVGIAGICWYILQFRENQVFFQNVNPVDNWLTAGASYVSYNILTAGVILSEMGSTMRKKRFGTAGVISAVIFCLMLLCLWAVLSIYYRKIPLGSIPMLTICKRQGTVVSLLYMAVLFAAMLTTALSNGYAVVGRLSQTMNRHLAAALVAGIGYFGAGLSFSAIVGIVYRILGYLGVLLVGFVLWDGIKMKKEEKCKKQKKTEDFKR